jgi:hypothetical protein
MDIDDGDLDSFYREQWAGALNRALKSTIEEYVLLRTSSSSVSDAGLREVRKLELAIRSMRKSVDVLEIGPSA